MSRRGLVMRATLVMVIGSMLFSGALTTTTRAAGPDKSDVVIDLDYSASILRDKANRD